jgi:tetratricopeptide (TPR) repeat protein
MKRFIVFTLISVAVLVGLACSKKPGGGIAAEKMREYANELYNRELYSQAVAEYRQYLDQFRPDKREQANISFIVGNIYFERLHDYESALSEYLKIRILYPESPLKPDVDRQVVACLERLQRSADAKQALDEATSLEPDKLPKPQPGAVVARIGDREYTAGDLKVQIDRLPESVKGQLSDREARLSFLRQWMAAELFYDAAKRKGLDNDKDVVEGTFQTKKSLMVQKYLGEEIAGQVQITEPDVELYYKANLDKYAEKDAKGKVTRQKPFQEVARQAAEDLMRERQQKAYEEIVGRMLNAENVQIFDDKVN